MRLHSLRFAALGPFAGEEALDFNALAQSGIFLFEGPTGSGKSSIIDAIVFALYGVIADADNKAKERMRSDFATPDTESYVDLVFETNRGVFRVRRTPSYERPRQRGGGTTTQNATAKLWRLSAADLDAVATLNGRQPNGSHDELDARGELISHRANEVGTEIEQIIGLNRKQFVQTIVLPQGLFAQFLMAKAEERSIILRKVFRTEMYVQFEDALRSRASAKANQIRSAKDAIDAARQSLLKAVGEPDGSEFLVAQLAALQDAPLTAAPGADSPDASQIAATVNSYFVELREAAYKKWQATKQRRIDADASLKEADRLLKLAEQRSDALEQIAHLKEAQPRIDELRGKLDANGRAAVVELASGRHRSSIATLAEFEQQLAAARDAAVTRHLDMPTELDEQMLRSRRDAVLEATGKVADAEASWRTVERLAQRREDCANEVKENEAKQDELESRAKDLPAQRDALKERLSAVASAETDLVRAEHSEESAHAHLKAVRRLNKIVPQWHEACGLLQSKASDAAESVRQAADLQLARLANMSAELAERLLPGTPCPVCGSVEHPHPAQPDPSAVTIDEVTAAEDARDEATTAAAAQEVLVTELRQQCVTLLEPLRDDFTPVTELIAQLSGTSRPAEDESAPSDIDRLLAALVAEATTVHDEAITARDTAQEAVALIQQLRGEHEKLVTLAEQIKAEQQKVTLRATSLAAQLAEITTQYDAALADSQQHLADLEQYRIPEVSDSTPLNTDTSPERATTGAGPVTEPAAAIALLKQHEQFIAAQGSALERLEEVWAEWQQAQRITANLHTALLETVAEQGFTTLDEAVESLLTEDTATALTRTVADHDEQLTRARTILQLPEIVALPETLDFDLDQLSATAEAAATAEQEAETSHTEQVAHTSRIEATATALRDAASEYESLLDASATLVRLAELVTGTSSDNRIRMTLSTYVLVQRFEAVVDAANLRLENLSNGRYRLERTEERENARERRVGLALQIVDNETEKARPTRSLSGGETFYVSLCLALGLADIVMSESGARDFGTLIIDEGFGTLDAEKLETVLHELAQLRTDGRTIGVVSHVEALKTVIAEQIQVRPASPHGSTVRVIS